MPQKTERFIVIKGSLSAHCCFEYTIVDTIYGKEKIGDDSYWKKTMCEVFEEEEAIQICNALNFYNKNNKQ